MATGLKSDKMRLIIVRHGQTHDNAAGIVQGHRHDQLNNHGVNQAEKVAKFLRAEQIDVAYSSDSTRAHHTATIIMKYHPAVKLITEPMMRERHSGIYEGQHGDIMTAALKQSHVNPHDWQPEGGESLRQLFDRASQWYDLIKQRHHQQTVLLVSHGGFIRSLLTAIIEGPEYHFNLAYRHDNTGVTVIDIDHHGQPTIQALNSLRHLP